MTKKNKKSLRQTNPALMRGIYTAVIVGIVLVFVIVTLESILSILSDAFAW